MPTPIMKLIFINFIVMISIEEHLFQETNPVYEAEEYTDTFNCHQVLPKALRDEIASYKFLVKVVTNVISSPGHSRRFYDMFTRFIDKFGPRPSGSKNLERSIDYMINLTIASGINDVTTEDVEVPHWVRGEETAIVLNPREKRLQILGLGPSIPTPSGGITAETIVVKSFDELAKLPNEYVEGKIVIFNPTFTSYRETVEYRRLGASKAAVKGAVATLIKSMTPFSLYTPHTGSQDYADNVTMIPAASITVEDADLLERVYKTGEIIVIFLKMKNSYNTETSRNTYISLKGKEEPENLVIVSGHIDSWDVGQGALDNGGGMFISWYAPVILHQLGLRPRRTIQAILWTAEEVGLVGSADFIKRHWKEFNKINFILESDEGTFNPLGLEVSGTQKARCIIAEILKLFPKTNKIKENNSPGSDIEAIVEQGVPGASLLNENERYFLYHHTEADTMNVYTMEEVVNCAAFWAAVSYVIADLSVDIPDSLQYFSNFGIK